MLVIATHLHAAIYPEEALLAVAAVRLAPSQESTLGAAARKGTVHGACNTGRGASTCSSRIASRLSLLKLLKGPPAHFRVVSSVGAQCFDHSTHVQAALPGVGGRGGGGGWGGPRGPGQRGVGGEGRGGAQWCQDRWVWGSSGQLGVAYFLTCHEDCRT